jgi:hypothetical protein
MWDTNLSNIKCTNFWKTEKLSSLSVYKQTVLRTDLKEIKEEELGENTTISHLSYNQTYNTILNQT